MFGNDPNSLTKTLGEMASTALRQCNSNQTEAKVQMTLWLANDRRFDAYDPYRLVNRVNDCWSNGAHLDLDDPQLLKGGQPRPLDRWR